MASRHTIHITQDQLADFGRRWKVKQLALFGPVIRDESRPDRNIDLLVQFYPDARWNLFDLVTMQNELEKLSGRKVVLLEREGLTNPFRQRSILSHLEIIYESSRP